MKRIIILTISAGIYLLAAAPIFATTFTFGGAGDYANGSAFHGTVSQVSSNNVDFQLAVGDLAYSTVEQSWCNYWKTNGVNNIIIVAGNHDSGESSAGNINTYVQHCPFTLSSTVVGTYGKEYYFDYPATNPIARFIMISPGIGGSYMGIDTNYSIGHPGYDFTANAVDDAKAKGIKWVIVGMHKNYISVMEKGNELGKDLIPMLMDKRVDIIIQGHEHGYERSKQLTCAKTNTYDSTCVANAGNNLTKGAGTIIQVIGTGGQGLRGLNTADSEYSYFATVDNRSHGFGKFTVSDNSLSYQFVPNSGGNLSDSFTITDCADCAIPTNTPTPEACNTPSTNAGTVSQSFQITNAGVYTIWSRIRSSQSNASLWLTIDSNCPLHYILPNTTNWTWINYLNGTASQESNSDLSVGSHQITISADNQVELDRVILDNAGCTPTDTGDNCVGSIPIDTPVAPNCSVGDLDCSGKVNSSDLTALLSKFGSNDATADLDGSGKVNAIDMTILLTHFGQ